jgi:hypothetical protein
MAAVRGLDDEIINAQLVRSHLLGIQMSRMSLVKMNEQGGLLPWGPGCHASDGTGQSPSGR